MWQDAKLLNAIANALFGLVLLALVASGVWWVIQRPLFTLQTVRVEGENKSDLRHVNALTIRDQAIPKIGGNFFTANLDQVRLAFESVPWVRKASVQRVWPNKLIVSLQEHEVLGTWGEDGRLISMAGDVFTANLAEAEEDAQLVGFVGPEGSEKEVIAQYRQFKNWFASINLEPETVEYSSRYAWSVVLNNGLRVELGKVQEQGILKRRVEQLIKVYPQLVTRLQDRIVSVDMRYPNGLALQSSGSGFGLNRKLGSK
ncbi:cell division protein FtsQ/DivIB [Undibacterium seohonense]|jgi:cell division protein FtsQ|uniref:Cell division protein FtsQ n=1 Tax=Undibacterium seohonense TaxID=1344950 RepID=A0ABR6X5K1_9BURK|nr:cell division protein FtsQ/DivIB [Undibacterium seohonense]MBC3808220.1 cell division protein FtsQ/DivIB [Undibacterium seohonense]